MRVGLPSVSCGVAGQREADRRRGGGIAQPGPYWIVAGIAGDPYLSYDAAPSVAGRMNVREERSMEDRQVIESGESKRLAMKDVITLVIFNVAILIVMVVVKILITVLATPAFNYLA